jgi:alanyl-tRNA synthetase
MTMLSSREIRSQFIDYFASRRGHTVVASSPVVPHDDPTLLFANAGMNQFKPYFLGTETPPYPRAVNTQKCIRAGGKHNDLEDVGKDTYHHTFFEMLGNWSFGDYFKADAIEWAWDLLVNVWGLDPKRLHATYFEGDTADGLEPDVEARDLWLKLLPTERVHPGNKKDNFWEMGDTGPCGPCSELHYDRTADKSGGGLVNGDDPAMFEIWNLVFIQFNRAGDGQLSPLPARHVDTGLGFERICAVLQEKMSNYETDVFLPLFSAIQKATGAAAYTGELDKPEDVAYRVIADHIRTLTFALTDGAHCGNEGRDYVLRSILRRAVRYGRQTLGVHKPFFYKLVPCVVENFSNAFPELTAKADAVAAEIKDEEDNFSRTLDRGIELFEQAAARGGNAVSDDDAFKLHDTYGFPIGLTQLMAEERGMTVDIVGFERLMEDARQRSRGEGGGADSRASLVELVQKQSLGATDFLGAEVTELEHEVNVRVFRLGNNCGNYKTTEKASVGKQVAVVLDATVFYAEGGGQVGDTGSIEMAGGEKVVVADTVRVGDVVFHLGEVVGGPLFDGVAATATMRVDAKRRGKIMANHTSTHMLNRALRLHVNKEADQKGSLLDDEKLRFDFSHNSALSVEQVAAVEKKINEDIAADLKVYYANAPQEEALKINGLRAVFGEKYPPLVRVVSIGARVSELLAQPGKSDWANYSIEFCGGTHLARTGEAGEFVIVQEDAVAKGVRRITALTGDAALAVTEAGTRLLEQLAARPEDLADHVATLTKAMSAQTLPLLVRAKLRSGIAALQEQIKQQNKERSKEDSGRVIELARQLAEQSGGDCIVGSFADTDAAALRTAMDVVRKKHADAALLLAGVSEGKVALVASVPKYKIACGLKAGDWIKATAKVVGGGGGGRPDMAQAGGKDPGKVEEALVVAREFAAAKLG